MRWFSSDAGQVAKIEAPLRLCECAGTRVVSPGLPAEAGEWVGQRYAKFTTDDQR